MITSKKEYAITTHAIKIYEMRNQNVMPDFDLATLYEVEIRVFSQAVKRNLKGFPEAFMFRLQEAKWKEIFSSQIVVKKDILKNRKRSALCFYRTWHNNVGHCFEKHK